VTCNLIEDKGNLEQSGNNLMMTVNTAAGYEKDATVNCDSYGGNLVKSASGKVYKKSVDKGINGSKISSKTAVDTEDCLKYCEDTTGCVSVVFRVSDKRCVTKNANSCDGVSQSNSGYNLFEVAEVLSRTCTEQNKNDIFPTSYAFGTKTFKIEQKKYYPIT